MINIYNYNNGYGFDQYGFDRDGYDEEGFDEYGYDRKGYRKVFKHKQLINIYFLHLSILKNANHTN